MVMNKTDTIEQSYFFNDLNDLLKVFNITFELFTVVVNIFHLSVLIRKSLRTNSIFILMIGISIADIIGLSLNVHDEAVALRWFKSIANVFRSAEQEPKCLPFAYFGTDIFHVLEVLILNSTRPISIWLAILMAFIRALSIILPMSNRVQNMTKPKWTISMMSVIFVFWIFYYSWELRSLQYVWVTKKYSLTCHLPGHLPKNLEKNAFRVLVISTDSYLWSRDRVTWEYLIRLVPAFLYPILTVPLIVQLWKTKKRRQANNIKNEKSDQTIFLIIFMTLSFMLSEGLAGIFEYSEFLTSSDLINGMRGVTQRLSGVFSNLRTLNALSHFFVCIVMSSQYRSIVTGTFKCCKFKKKTILVQQGTSVRETTKVNETIISKTL